MIFISFGSMIDADPYSNPAAQGPAPPPPFGVSGKEFPPGSTSCPNCSPQNITCPSQCPSFKPSDPMAKACSIDCNSPTCEATCISRQPNCNGKGSGCGDPRFVGGDGIVFYFHGKTNQQFALVSDQNLQINARFIGHRPEGRKRDNTWIQALGLVFHDGHRQSHTFTLASSTKVAQWDDNVDRLHFTYDDKSLIIGEGHLFNWDAPDGSGLFVERTSKVNSITVTLPNLVEISASVVPITREDDRIHNYQIPLSQDCFAHLEVQFRFFRMSESVEGVLGQTYRPDFQNPVKRGVAMPIMGGERNYMTSSLTSVDCNNCIFSLSDQYDSLVSKPLPLEEVTNTVKCRSMNDAGRGVVCRR
ncbi:hypothetical protein RHMOL_Rhmol05G0173600 [Rhododendron molle]|uniref:Uncharacterized protein n=1 Tax=Rhododendron molle TaxID=49168 RepID=A0ACC0NQ60_RHOML|nr:hypothetical protein RHMOL_Rhmol05G0173600 [Rhododendron molle]